MGRIKSNATLLDLDKTPKQIENLKKIIEGQTKQRTKTSSIAITEWINNLSILLKK